MRVIRTIDALGATVWAGSTDHGASYYRLFDLFEAGCELTTERLEPTVRLAPVRPPAILGIGQNYGRHAAEMGGAPPERPVMFMKNPNSVQDPAGPIVLPLNLKSEKVDYEAELAIVIGKRCKNVRPEDAHEVILGFTCANDVSARDWQKEWGGGQWCKGKSFDTFCPLGPEIVTWGELGDPQNLRIMTRVNGETLQDWTTADMIFSISELVAYCSGDMTLEPGTVILTGTPHGVGTARTPPIYLQPGDIVEIEIEDIGILRNPVVAGPENE